MAYPDISHLIHDENVPFFEATKQNKLVVQYCASCGKRQFYPRVFCMNCFSEVEWIEASGRGKVYSFTVVHKTFHKEMQDKVPYVLALIELEEQVRMMSHVVDVNPEDVRVGMDVSVVFRENIGEYQLPLFVPCE